MAEKEQLEQAQAFLRRFFPIISGKLLIWEKNGKQSTWYDSVDAAAEFAAGKTDVYFGCGLSPKNFGAKKRCPAAQISAISGLWLDVDFKVDSHHKAADLPKINDKKVDEFFKSIVPFQPTLTNFTGGGFHLFWRFKELWELENQSDRMEAAALSSDFQAYFRRVFQEQKGWSLDNTSDLARILRIPGTYNGKNDTLIEVHTVDDDDSKFLASHSQSFLFPDDIRDFLDDANSMLSVFDYQGNAETNTHETQKVDSDATSTQKTAIYQEIKDVQIIADRCSFVAHCVKDAKILPEPHWYALATVCARCNNGNEIFHQWSKLYPHYSKAEADLKLKQAFDNSGPITCQYVQKNFGAIFCQNCTFKSVVRSPIATALFPDDLPSIIVDENATVPLSKFKALCRLEPRLEDSFYRRRRDLKDSRACEVSVAHFCVSAGWQDQEIANILVAFHLEAHETVKPAEHYQRIIALATKGKKRQEADEVIQAAIDLGEEPTQEQLLEAVSTELGFRVLRFVKFLSEPPMFRLETVLGNCNLGENILSQSLVRQKIYADLNVVLPRFSSAHYDRVVEALARIRDEEYVGEEATVAGAVALWVRRYVERKNPTDDYEDAERDRYPFSKGNATYFFGSDFVKFLYTEFNERISRKEMGIFLRQSNFEAQKIRVSKKVCHVWLIPESVLVKVTDEEK